MIKLETLQRPHKKGRPRLEERDQTIEARKPWIELGMSRTTWYRRQAEKRGETLKPTTGLSIADHIFYTYPCEGGRLVTARRKTSPDV